MSNGIKRIININGQEVIVSTRDKEGFDRIITVDEEITMKYAAEFNSAVRNYSNESKDPIYIYMYSPGGSVSAGLSMYDTLKASKCEIYMIACGMPASMGAFLVAAAGTKGKRYIQPNAEMLIHQPLGGIQGQASDIRIHAEHIIKSRSKLNTILSECTGQPVEKIEVDTERDYIMNAQEAVEYGLVDFIGDPILECE